MFPGMGEDNFCSRCCGFTLKTSSPKARKLGQALFGVAIFHFLLMASKIVIFQPWGAISDFFTALWAVMITRRFLRRSDSEFSVVSSSVGWLSLGPLCRVRE